MTGTDLGGWRTPASNTGMVISIHNPTLKTSEKGQAKNLQYIWVYSGEPAYVKSFFKHRCSMIRKTSQLSSFDYFTCMCLLLWVVVWWEESLSQVAGRMSWNNRGLLLEVVFSTNFWTQGTSEAGFGCRGSSFGEDRTWEAAGVTPPLFCTIFKRKRIRFFFQWRRQTVGHLSCFPISAY